MLSMLSFHVFLVFFFNDTATTEIYTLSLHDALPILPSSTRMCTPISSPQRGLWSWARSEEHTLNSSHEWISYAVFCLKKKKDKYQTHRIKKKKKKIKRSRRDERTR